MIPRAWRPPFIVLTTDVYARWIASQVDLKDIVAAVEQASRGWRSEWPRGLILRSSADNETLEDRGANTSVKLAADFDVPQLEEALARIFDSFSRRAAADRLAIVVQPLAKEGPMGHLSNERRISKTINQWRWEKLSPDIDEGRLNSQRDKAPDLHAPLVTQPKFLVRAFGRVGRWITNLRRGPAHLEWIHDGHTLWLLQIDFEHEQPDDGIDPVVLLRDSDNLPSGKLPPGSSLTLVDLDPRGSPTPWRKIENVRRFAAIRHQPFPPLAAISGDCLLDALANGRGALEADLRAFAHERVVCRTDCKADDVSRENLPRTYTVSSTLAVDHMAEFLGRMAETGTSANDVCFLAHKFVPAQSGAWASADPGSSVVRVDALWGVPDGLQYLPHDTFDVDVQRKTLLAERLRYKPRFIQEWQDGTWRELKVRRTLGRARSLPTSDAVEIAIVSHEIARQAERPLLVMWFSVIPLELGIGRNLPWFSMPPNAARSLLSGTVSPRWPRKVLRTREDVNVASVTGVARQVLVLDPELALFRDESFLKEVAQLAKRDNCPVQLAGSTLAHAHYQLEKAGVSVVPADGPVRSRARGRRSFAKLVRNDMPAQIADRGEIVLQSRLPRSEMRKALAAKLLEEVQELLAATDPDDVKGELVDLLEVIRAMAGVTGVAWSEVEIAATEKREKRGGFEDGTVLVGTEWPASGRTTHRTPQMITLLDLGKVLSNANGGIASYNALLASAKGVGLEVAGRTLRVRLTRDGVAISVHDLDTLPAQLELPFEIEQERAFKDG